MDDEFAQVVKLLGAGSSGAAVLWLLMKLYNMFSSSASAVTADRTSDSLMNHFSAELQRLEGIIDRQTQRIDAQAQMISKLSSNYTLIKALLMDSRDVLRAAAPSLGEETATGARVVDLCARIDRAVTETEDDNVPT